ncbi:ATPase [Candidatus Gracilibacteria bacterium HOT-871]|nr:ATPase [Candidatus Gracilibacteria bacterium HOT-871]RKW23983.1 MAG: MoxR family ATPase [Candidatus Gracilibacteria bacterium]
MQNLEIEVLEASKKISELKNEISQKIVGQKDLVDSIIICLLGGGHILLEGLPGLAKTLTISTVSKCLDLGFSRVQFTPDLLPSDLIGTEIFNVKTSNFDIKKGPIFSNFVLADEINRAPSKVQSALLEAMAEKSITIGKETFVLEEPFLVLATQNPIEQSGTYKLPEAQLDRFALKVKVDYPSFEEEKEVYKNIISGQKVEIKKILSKSDIFQLQGLVKNIFVSDAIFDYVSRIVDATRNPEKYGLEKYKKYISFGVSPRGGLSLLSSAKALAFMEERSFVIPEDIKKLAISTLAHRLVLSYEAIADEIDEYFLIEKIISKIKIS